MRLLHRPGEGLHPAERDELAVIGGLGLGPEGAHGLEIIYRAWPFLLEGDAERIELGLEIPNPHAENHSALRQDVKTGQFFGQD
jgi:hypothetical protein